MSEGTFGNCLVHFPAQTRANYTSYRALSSQALSISKEEDVSRVEDATASLNNLLQHFTFLTVKNFFLIPIQNFSCCNISSLLLTFTSAPPGDCLLCDHPSDLSGPPADSFRYRLHLPCTGEPKTACSTPDAIPPVLN
ncbi:hypothetical protein llap_8093 [Limosa lapponica baueri]|uniref:Uncharacterized protein n=1 Tax=Limosa lapponica baueri TaxID=1758121 RepID=A0A2I0U681_LIMLA|nr:hypothetical protein llap_8093 [Limosa lapponica baueri]